MEWDYHVKVEVDTNDADYIHDDYHFGTYDDENEQDMKRLAVDVLVYNNFYVENGENTFYVCDFLKELKKFGLKPSDRNEDWKKYDRLLDYDSVAFEDLGKDDYDSAAFEDLDKDEDEDNGEVPECVLALADDLKCEVEDEIGDMLPWMDNCWNNHSFNYELTRRPAGVKEENCEVNYDAKTYKELLTYESIDELEDDFEDDLEGEDD